ncbi:Methane oxygenase PmoA [Actinacidiphila yanglinensis]|uniref:Methane oxygenase PmoA n=1 Tax=Actinacidiphila yanglinensis TaxID=310779 RepID=A0A1H6AWV7_9ACTN|nr:PmoA family protein [Actinacidiphila yanglinensis]SEG53091.1 Methane oxygenase PmoA [Actinacidiphila yanglinensis]
MPAGADAAGRAVRDPAGPAPYGPGGRDPHAVPLRLHHDPAAGVLVVTAGRTAVARYVYRPDTPAEESPKPYFHPLRTLSGAPLGVHRPWDHRWHTGLQFTWSHLSGDNFWGGPTFDPAAPGDGYVWRRNHGRQVHRGFERCDTAGAGVGFRERLDWIAARGERWIDESRTVRCHGVDAHRGLWVLDFGTALTNVRGAPLHFGSPTTRGRPGAGYTGLFWRGPRAWTGAPVVAADGSAGDAVMGSQAPWAAVSGEHDALDGGATVLAYAGTSSAPAPIRWFARSAEYAALNPSPAFDTEIVLAAGGTLRLAHRFVFVDKRTEPAELAVLAAEFAPPPGL